MPQVQRIDPIMLPNEKESVAAYCRVSTNSADQLNSYNSQIAYYTKLINENPDWELYDIYADAGITGTSIEKRDEFQRMLADCREGKIKRVLVKSVSRFARNTTELLETTRKLNDLGVVVIFEEQGFDTSQVLGEMQLALFAMAAQEESFSISKNMRWSYQKRMQNGTFACCLPPVGYDLKNGTLTENHDAGIVKEIFKRYNSGEGMTKIAAYLNEQYPDGKSWGRTAISKVLRNEKYIGDSLLQKGFTSDTLPFVRKENKGERPQYYVEGTHTGIIDKRCFESSSTLRERRLHEKSKGKEHLFTHRLLCANCGHHMRQVTSNGKSYWLCAGRAGQVTDCDYFRLAEDSIIIASLNMMTKIFLNHDNIILPTIAHLREIEYTQSGSDTKLSELDLSLAAINDRSLTLQKLNTKGFISPEEYRFQSEALAAQRKRITAERNKKLNGLQSHSAIEKLEELQAILSSWPGLPTEFDIDQFDEVIEKIIPTADNKLTFRLHCGLELTEEIPS